MSAVNNFEVKKFNLPGLTHQTLCGPSHGVNSFELWYQKIEPNAATPIHKHNCDEAIVVIKGHGQFTINGKTIEFGPGATLIIPPNTIHQIINSGNEEMELIATLSIPNVEIFTPDNKIIPLPWQNN